MHSSVIEHGMTSLSFQTAVQKNEARLVRALFSDNARLAQWRIIDTTVQK